MRLRLVPTNPTVGDLEGNASRLRACIEQAARDNVDCIAFPELALCGYPPRDLLLHEAFVREAMDRAAALARHARGVTALVGAPWLVDPERFDAGLHNSLLALRDGAILARHDKRLLPSYDVFDEDRHFRPSHAAHVLDVAGVPVGLSICEDLWRGADAGALARYAEREDPVEALVRAGAQLIVNASASPFVLGKGAVQRRILTEHVRRHAFALAAVNQLGGNDDLIFDGRAEVHVPDPASPSGSRLLAVGPAFSETAVTVEIPADRTAWPALAHVPDPLDTQPDEALLWRALVLGTRDYCRKTGFSGAALGLSGGIDSAVACCIAAAALGPRNVLALSMPSRFSSEGSRADAAALALALGVRLQTVPIDTPHRALEAILAPGFASLGRPRPDPGAPDIAMENVQSRLRGLILMAYSNESGAILLTTGNKSELGVGYCTIYGDMNGGLAVLADVTKARVYALARWINAHAAELGFTDAPPGGPIPRSTIDKPPSAELRPNQTDQDTLPPYHAVDAVIEAYVERHESAQQAAASTGVPIETVRRLTRMIDASEFKRRQAAPGLKVTGVAFGAGRRMPIAQGWKP